MDYFCHVTGVVVSRNREFLHAGRLCTSAFGDSACCRIDPVDSGEKID